MLSQAFWFLAILVGLPFPIMMCVDVERGRAEGVALARELEDIQRKEERERLLNEDESDDELDREQTPTQRDYGTV